MILFINKNNYYIWCVANLFENQPTIGTKQIIKQEYLPMSSVESFSIDAQASFQFDSTISQAIWVTNHLTSHCAYLIGWKYYICNS